MCGSLALDRRFKHSPKKSHVSFSGKNRLSGTSKSPNDFTSSLTDGKKLIIRRSKRSKLSVNVSLFSIALYFNMDNRQPNGEFSNDE
uniref:Uncharacterized protein n=1 Tax=Romanomermis culicivorax TaxID=13658 RepID=A0A915HQL2_ROMCU